jgi:HlyD family secretion protein
MHTAPAEVTPETESSPDQLGPQPKLFANHPNRPNRGRTRIFVATVVLALGAVAWLALRNRSASTARLLASNTLNPDRIVRLKGTTEAVEARAILAPLLSGQQVHTLTIIHLATGGVRVKKGDVLVEFDRQDQLREFVDKQADYQKLVDQVAQEQAKESAAQAKDETELKTAEDALTKAQLELRRSEIVSRIDAEKNQETFEEAKATYDQLRETFDLKRKAAQAAIRILEIQRDRTHETMMHAQANADLMQIHSPLDGVVVLNTIWKQGTMGEVQEGDQIRAGVPFMQVVSPSIMQVRVLANQQDFPSLAVGQAAKVRLDAYPDMVFPAKLDQISPIGEGGDFSSKLRVFVVIVAIQGNDPKLMPDLSAAVDVNVSERNARPKTATAQADGSSGSGSL